MTETEDFLDLLTDPVGHGIRKAMAGLREANIQIIEIDLEFEFDEFRQIDIWRADITGTNVEMFQGMRLEEQVAEQVEKHTDCWILSSQSPRYINHFPEGKREGYVAQQFNISRRTWE